jgi:hypothetical protein
LNDAFSVSSFSSVEDTSNEYYLKHHDQFESRERRYRESLEENKKKKTRNNKANLININSKPQNLDSTITETSESCFKFRIEIDNN